VFGDAAADAAARVVDLTPSGLAGARGTAADQEEESWLEGLFGRTHVLVVHFPIALLIAAALAELLAVARRSNALRSAAHYCVNLALPFAAWTFFSGNEMEEQARVGPMLHETLEQHELFGQITAGLVAGVFLLGWLARRPGASARTTTLWRLLLIASAVMVALTAHEGGQLVHGLGFPFD
jgi:uncharacterized membrane protein